MIWTTTLDRKLTELAKTGKYFYSEIAVQMNLKATCVRYRARQLKLPSHPCPNRFGQWNSKHAHLSEEVMIYFMKHSDAECMKKFKLTPSELKSLKTRAYRDPKLTLLRKNTRTQAPWTITDYLFMTRRAGMMERGKIATLMGRSVEGKHHAVKERMKKMGGGSSKFLNGMPIGWASKLWPLEMIESYGIKTKAGPTGGDRGNFRFKIIPWIHAERFAKVFVTPPEVVSCISSMAKFQRFIHARTDRAITSSLKRYARAK